MISTKDCRMIEVWNTKIQSWVPAHLENLVQGDIFRMWERTGEPVKDAAGNGIFIAATAAQISCDPYNGHLPKEGPVLT